jgi:uncharacterized protein (DUF1499 family)
MPPFAALGRLFGAPGTPPFHEVPSRAAARALLDRGSGPNVAVGEPVALPFAPDQAHARVLGAIGTLRGWHLVGASPDVVWATRTTPMLGFVDDVLVLLTPGAAGTVVEARSASRVGRGDLGRNRMTLRELRDVLRRWA